MQPDTNIKLYVITGGPGAGKTTLLEELSGKGLITVPEEARRIIREQIRCKGSGLPWMDKKLFAKLMFEASVKTYQEISRSPGVKPVFFDRGIPDTVCYLKMEKIPVSKEMKAKVCKMPYNKDIFILPPWKEIYENDPERKQTWEEAVFTFSSMKETYREYGYHIIEVPRDTVEQRSNFILNIIEKEQSGFSDHNNCVIL